MPRDYLPASDAAFDLWLKNFVSELTTRAAALDFDPAEVTAIGDALGLWESAFGDRLTTQAAARGATAAKRDARRAALLLVRPYVRRAQAHPTMTDTIRAAMRLTLLDELAGGNGTAVAFDETPLLALDFGTRGQITVHFGPNPGNENRNPLPAGAIGAVLQTRAGGEDGDWEWLDNPSASPYTHVVQPSAVTTIGYRCAYLFRRGRKGPWSAPAEAAVTP